MKSGRSSAAAAALGLAGGLALGIWIGSAMSRDGDAAPAAAAIADVTEPTAAAPAAGKSAAARPAARAPEGAVASVPVTAPELHDRIKPVLARGTNVEIAIDGFDDAEQFATIAHAAHNTQVPFILLKHRVLTEGQSLADAIRASNDDVDADAEVARARHAARADLAAVSAEPRQVAEARPE